MNTNTESAGGTRYSAGKPKPLWVPWRGISLVREAWAASEDAPFYLNQEDALGQGFEALVECLQDPQQVDQYGVYTVAKAALHLMACLADVRGEIDRVPVGGMMHVCDVSEMGAEKYAPLDWDIGQSFSTLLNSAMRHLIHAISLGHDVPDPESGLPSVAHALWNLMCILDFIVQGRADAMDDVTCWRGVSAEERRETEALTLGVAFLGRTSDA